MLDKEILLEHLTDIIIVTDKKNNIIYNNNKNFEQFVNLISNDYTGEIHIEKQNKWYHIFPREKIREYFVYIIRDITIYKDKEQSLQTQITLDSLTGLYNRQGIEININKAIEIFKKSDKPFTIIICDIDHFKQINDKYGHLTGDVVLRKIGEILKRNIRKNDFVGRYGGEEFMILLNTDDLEQIKSRIEQIKGKIENEKFKYNGTTFNLTMTFGIQIYDGKKQIEKVMKEADDALYYGKNNGRNQIVIYDEINNQLKNKKL